MSFELDHFFILTSPGAPQAELLSGIGLIEGSPNDHPGQGTANRRFFFSDSMLELIYIRDANEAANGPGSRLGFVERAKDPSASPFGLIFKEVPKSSGAPFPGWLAGRRREHPPRSPPDRRRVPEPRAACRGTGSW